MLKVPSFAVNSSINRFAYMPGILDEYLQHCLHRRRKGSVVGGHHGECGARAYNGGMGAEPPAGSRGRAPGQGVRGTKPPWSWKHFGHRMSKWAGKFSTSLWKQYALLRSTVVRVGRPRVHDAPPTPSLGGCPPAPPPMIAYDIMAQYWTIIYYPSILWRVVCTARTCYSGGHD